LSLTFAILAAMTLVGAVAALSLRNLVHCALSLMVAFAGLAGVYVHLGAQFVGLAQVLVYVGAVAILIVFAILLTRGGGNVVDRRNLRFWISGVGIAAFLFLVLTAVIRSSEKLRQLGAGSATRPKVSVRDIGEKLMTDYVLPLEVIALLLTAAMIGAVILAQREKNPEP
jgi:NADH-quinone oxidoreductase subunit J